MGVWSRVEVGVRGGVEGGVRVGTDLSQDTLLNQKHWPFSLQHNPGQPSGQPTLHQSLIKRSQDVAGGQRAIQQADSDFNSTNSGQETKGNLCQPSLPCSETRLVTDLQRCGPSDKVSSSTGYPLMTQNRFRLEIPSKFLLPSYFGSAFSSEIS